MPSFNLGESIGAAAGNVAVKQLLTGDALNGVCATLTNDRAALIADLVNRICPSYGIDSANILHEFIATCAEESIEFTHKSENLNYSAQALVNTFGKKYFRTMIEAQRYERQPEKIANYVYGGRMGNVNGGDGYLFRGGGFIQITGRELYEPYARRNNITAEDAANRVRTDDRYALDSACFVFAVVKKLVPLAQQDRFLEISQRINGSQNPNGMAERNRYYLLAKQFIH